MRRPIPCLFPFAMVTVAACVVEAGTLEVGPGRKYARPSEAIGAAKDGDVVEIDSAGSYGGDVSTIRANRLTIRGVGAGRVKLPAEGHHAGGKAIWVAAGDEITVENIEFSGCRVPDRNGAGIRVEGANLTVRGCRFYDCENGMLGGKKGTLLIEHCEFDHCGPVADPATHSCYVSADRLIFRHNYSTFTHEGHLLKTRAKESWILYNRLTDEKGTGSAVIDIPDGGVAIVVGNVLHKGPEAQNTRVVAYGMEGIKHGRNALYVVNNTMVYENRRRTSWFVRAENVPEGFVPVIRNNLCIGPIPLTNHPKAEEAGNIVLKSVEEARLADPARYDDRPKAGSPCIDKGVEPGKAGEISLKPEFQYVHPAKGEKRPDDGKIDVGAYEFAKGK